MVIRQLDCAGGLFERGFFAQFVPGRQIDSVARTDVVAQAALHTAALLAGADTDLAAHAVTEQIAVAQGDVAADAFVAAVAGEEIDALGPGLVQLQFEIGGGGVGCIAPPGSIDPGEEAAAVEVAQAVIERLAARDLPGAQRDVVAHEAVRGVVAGVDHHHPAQHGERAGNDVQGDDGGRGSIIDLGLGFDPGIDIATVEQPAAHARRRLLPLAHVEGLADQGRGPAQHAGVEFGMSVEADDDLGDAVERTFRDRHGEVGLVAGRVPARGHRPDLDAVETGEQVDALHRACRAVDGARAIQGRSDAEDARIGGVEFAQAFRLAVALTREVDAVEPCARTLFDAEDHPLRCRLAADQVEGDGAVRMGAIVQSGLHRIGGVGEIGAPVALLEGFQFAPGDGGEFAFAHPIGAFPGHRDSAALAAAAGDG